MDRNGYVCCVPDLFHKRLKRRDIFATASARWADPRAQLLTEAAWESKREALLDELELPDDPGELLDGCAAELDAKWRYMAERASAGDITVDTEGRVHAAALAAVPAPASMLALRERCQDMMPRDVARLSPSMHAHINVHGHYSFAPLNLDAGIGNRPLRNPATEGLTKSAPGWPLGNSS